MAAKKKINSKAGSHMTMKRHGTQKGSNNGRAKLNEELVIKIRDEYKSKRGDVTRLSKKYGVGISAITQVIRRTYWSHI